VIEYIAAPSVGGQREALYQAWKRALNRDTKYRNDKSWYKVERDNGFIVKVRLFFTDENEFLLWLLKFS
jgi:hypothetical protein